MSLLIWYHKYTDTHHICTYFLILVSFASYFAKKVYLYTIIFLLNNPIFGTHIFCSHTPHNFNLHHTIPPTKKSQTEFLLLCETVNNVSIPFFKIVVKCVPCYKDPSVELQLRKVEMRIIEVPTQISPPCHHPKERNTSETQFSSPDLKLQDQQSWLWREVRWNWRQSEERFAAACSIPIHLCPWKFTGWSTANFVLYFPLWTCFLMFIICKM